MSSRVEVSIPLGGRVSRAPPSPRPYPSVKSRTRCDRPARPRGAALSKARIVWVSPADDDVPDFTDRQFVLTSFVVRLFPTREIGVERRSFLVVGHLKREMIQPHRLPSGRFERRRRRQLRSYRSIAGLREAVSVADLKIPSIRILHMKTLEPLAIVFAYRGKATLLEFRLHRLGVPGPDDKAEVLHHSGSLIGRLFKDGRAPMADVQHCLLAVIASQFPSHQCHVERGLLSVVRHLEGDVVERQGLPSRGREHRFDWGRCRLRVQWTRLCSIAISTLALPECERSKGRPDRRRSQDPQQFAARGPPEG